jgi:pimeloyl-ACP methyl ester carboxylesterase
VLAQAERFFVAAAEARIAAYAWGSGPAVLLVHGWGGHAGQFMSFVPALVEAGYRAVAFDAPRHGATMEGIPTVPSFAEAARAVAESVGGIEAVVGHSMGAAATTYALRRGLAAERAILLAPPGSMEAAAQRFAKALGLGGSGFRKMRRKFERRSGVSWDDLDVVRDAPGIRTPVLIVHDREDADVPYDECLEIVRAWPDARLLTTEGLGHHRILRDPGVVAQAVAFLGERERRSVAR